MFGLDILRWVILETVSSLGRRGGELAMLEQIIVIEHLLDFIHLLLVADPGSLES